MSGTTKPAGLDNQELLAALEAAAAHFRSNLHSSRGTAAREYLGARGLTRSTLERIGAGLAHDSWNDLLRALRPRFGERVLVNAGLVVRKAERRWTYDRFRNRVVFPIYDEQGRIIAFGGRALDGASPKYLNSPDTAVYEKGKTLYGLQWAIRAAAQRGRVLLVEGLLDAAAALQCGSEEVVACCGIAVTGAQAKLLCRIAPQVLLCLDQDDAGWRATRRCIGLLLELGVPTRVVELPRGRDPASCASQGPEVFLSRVERAVPCLEWLIRNTALQHDTTSPAGKGAFVAELIPMLLLVRNRPEQLAWLEVAARTGGFDLAAAEEELRCAEDGHHARLSSRRCRQSVGLPAD